MTDDNLNNNHNNHNDPMSSPEVQELSVCDSCGRMVPTANLLLHESRACPNRKLPAARNDFVADFDHGTVATATAPLEIYDIDDTDTEDDSIVCYSPPARVATTTANANTTDRPLAISVLSPTLQDSSAAEASLALPIVDGFEVIERPSPTTQEQPQPSPFSSQAAPSSPLHRFGAGLSHAFCQGGARSTSPPPTAHYPGARRRRQQQTRATAVDLTTDESNAATTDDNNSQWPCPHCTLLNHAGRMSCEACHYRKSGGLRQGQGRHDYAATFRNSRMLDSTTQPTTRAASLRDRQQQQQQQQQQSRPAPARTTQNMAIGGAVLGGVLGVASAMARGRPVAGAALDGALNGAVGSVFLNEVVQHVERSSSDRSVAAAATRQQHHAAENNTRRRRDMERMSSLDDLLARHLMEQELARPSGSGGNSGRRRGYAAYDPMLEYMIAFGGMQHRGPYGNHVDVSRMSYEELLARFGDGSENRGASAAQLRELPVQTIDDVAKLGEDCRDCSICLDEFQAGDKRKTLPCLHGFHEICANKWLSTNASCPICKHPVGR